MNNRIANILWLAIALACGSALAADGIRWAPDLNSARQASVQFKVPLLVHFYGDHCLPCKTLEQRVYSQDDLVKTLNTYFICVRVNASQDPQTAAQFGVHSWPTDVFLSHDGSTLFQGVCKQNPTDYYTTLQSVMMMNRDRNVMLAAREQQSARSQLPTDTLAQATATSSPTNPQLGANRAGQNAQIAATMTPGFYNSAAGQPQPANQSLAGSLAPNDGIVSGPMNVANQVQAIAAGGQMANQMVPRPASPTVGQLRRGELPPYTPAATARTVRGPTGADQAIAAYAGMNQVPAGSDVSPTERTLPSRSDMPTQHQLYAQTNAASPESQLASSQTSDGNAAASGAELQSKSAKPAGIARSTASAPAMLVSNPYYVEPGAAADAAPTAQVSQASPAQNVSATQDQQWKPASGVIQSGSMQPNMTMASHVMPSQSTTTPVQQRVPATTVANTMTMPALNLPLATPDVPVQSSTTPPEATPSEATTPAMKQPMIATSPTSPTTTTADEQAAVQQVAQSPSSTSTAAAEVVPEPAFGGYCVVEAKRGQWVRGQSQFAVQHLGKVYWLSSVEARAAFLAAPNTVAPVLSGFDPMILLTEGRLVPGSIHHTLHEQGTDQLFLFASPETMHAFYPNQDEKLFERHAKAVQALINQASKR